MITREIRNIDFEIRANESVRNGIRMGRITGTPIVFDQVTDLGWIRETIMPGALDKTDLRDVRFLVGHDTTSIPLARSRNNNENSTMQMTVTERGMEIRVDLDIDRNPRAMELYSAVQRGDISGMSFAFTVDKDEWEDLESEQPLRRVTSIGRVFEVSAVTFPAYEGTDIQAADRDHALESVRASLESARKAAADERAREAEEERRRAALERLVADAESLRAAPEQPGTDAESRKEDPERTGAGAESLRADPDRTGAGADDLRADPERQTAEAERRRAALERLENLTKEVKANV